MKNREFSFAFILAIALVVFAQSCYSQNQKRIIAKTDKFDFGAGGTLSLIGAPKGSITIIGNPKNEIEITAKIEIEAPTEAELNILAAVTTFVLQESTGRVAIMSSGTHNKLGDKKLWKKFPKTLLGLPFKIDYVVKVPRYCDLDVNGGKGDIDISGIEGTFKIASIESNTKLSLIGGGIAATIGSGTVDISMPDRSWRGNAVDVALANGTMTAHLPSSISADLDAAILKSGKIESAFVDWKPRTRTVPFTEQSMIAKAGNGGVPMKFTVGEGTLKLLRIAKPN